MGRGWEVRRWLGHQAQSLLHFSLGFQAAVDAAGVELLSLGHQRSRSEHSYVAMNMWFGVLTYSPSPRKTLQAKPGLAAKMSK